MAASGASKGRGGKSVTLVRGLPMAGPALEQLGKQLRGLRQRRHRQDGVIEIQGDHRERVAQALAKLGHRAKLAGG